MGSVFYYALNALVGGLIFLGMYIFGLREGRADAPLLYVGAFMLCVGISGLAYWRWRRNKLRGKRG